MLKISWAIAFKCALSRLLHVQPVRWLAIAMPLSQKKNASESKEKLVDVYHADTRNLRVGDVVTVTASTQVAAQALLLGFGLPFVVLVAVLIAVLLITGNEGAAALSGLGALVPYYAVLFLFRNRIRDKLSFSIE